MVLGSLAILTFESRVGNMMYQYTFHPELFAIRDHAIGMLRAADFEPLIDYSDIEVDHARIGIEVRGIATEARARKILGILAPNLCSLPVRECVLDTGNIDPGWCAALLTRKRPPTKGT
jgi:hypothetical protein